MGAGWVVPLALLAGAVIAVQAGSNARLAQAAGGPVMAGLITCVVALVAMGVCVAALRPPVPAAADLAVAPWWAWIGGALGAAYVVAAAYLAPKLGAAAFAGFVIAGQLAASAALDHFGLVGFEKHPVGFTRLAGLALLLGGVYLVYRS
jgi:transporter family-2 protein